MTPPSRSPDQRIAGYPPRGGRGAAGTAGLDNGLAGGPSGIGVGGGPAGIGVGGGPGGFGVGGGPAGTGVAGGLARMGEAGSPAGTDNGVVGWARIGPAGSRPGIGNGLGSDGIGATGSPGSGLTADSETGEIGGLPYGLVQRVQRRLASTGSVATDTAGLRTAVIEALSEDGILLPAANLTPIVRAVGDELTGLGPLAPLLADPTVTDVLVNGPTEVWVERGGNIERAAVRFASPAAVAALVQRVVAPLGLRVDESRPWVDARLPGGERFHAVLPPLAPDGPVITIRTFARRRLQLSDLIDRGALDVATARLLEAMVAAGIAIAISGATGTGKTTLLNVLAGAIPTRERIVTIEDVAELSLPGPHVVRLEARPPNVEGRGEVPLRELVRNALRMRPDRIVVGEVRGPEVLDMLQAANTGHRGLMTTLHAGGPEEVPARLEAMALSAPGARLDVVRRLVRGGIGAVVHLERTLTGRPTRRVSVVAELVTTDDGRARAIPLRTATSNTELSATGHVPRWADHLDPVVLTTFEPTHLAGRVRVLCPRSPIR